MRRPGVRLVHVAVAVEASTGWGVFHVRRPGSDHAGTGAGPATGAAAGRIRPRDHRGQHRRRPRRRDRRAAHRAVWSLCIPFAPRQSREADSRGGDCCARHHRRGRRARAVLPRHRAAAGTLPRWLRPRGVQHRPLRHPRAQGGVPQGWPRVLDGGPPRRRRAGHLSSLRAARPGCCSPLLHGRRHRGRPQRAGRPGQHPVRAPRAARPLRRPTSRGRGTRPARSAQAVSGVAGRRTVAGLRPAPRASARGGRARRSHILRLDHHRGHVPRGAHRCGQADPWGAARYGATPTSRAAPAPSAHSQREPPSHSGPGSVPPPPVRSGEGNSRALSRLPTTPRPIGLRRYSRSPVGKAVGARCGR